MKQEQILKKVDLLRIQGVTEKEYDNIHAWLRYNFGRPNCCEHCGTLGTKKKKLNLDWALIRGKTYERKRENFKGLCCSCHQKYDNPMPEWCETKNCDRPHYSKGFCQRCYNRNYARKTIGKNAWKWSKYD